MTLTDQGRFFQSVCSLLLVAFAVCAGTACRPALKTPPDTLVVGIESSPATLDPRLSADAYSSKITQLLHNGLFRLDERLQLQPDLLESYEEVSPIEYRFKLRPGVVFHDGTALDAADVMFSLNSVKDPALASPFRGAMEKIESLTSDGPLDVDVKLKEPFAPFLSSLTMGILPSEGGDPAVGTGPFRLESLKPAESVSLAANGRYYRGAPKTGRVLFRVIPDDNLRVLEIKNRRVDVLQNNVPPLLLEALKGDEGLVLETTEGINMTYLGMNLRDDPLKRPDVRRAIAMAIDIPGLIEYRMAKLARPATGLLSPVHWAYEGDVAATPFDPAKARELLDQAGFRDPDGAGPLPRFTITYKTSTKKDRVGLARLIARYLKDVGIEARVLPLDWGVFFSDVGKGNFQLYSLTWVGVTEPDLFFEVFHSSKTPPTGLNRGGYSDPIVDRLTEEGRRVVSPEERKAVYSEVQKILARELPIIPLWYESNYAVFGKNVKGLRLRPNASFEWAAEAYKEP
ncbi:MAG TPA: ABC transporter substrate-binding protein [bacterium]|nr:ABC transporter substrate-binding protein [bacterium]